MCFDQEIKLFGASINLGSNRGEVNKTKTHFSLFIAFYKTFFITLN